MDTLFAGYASSDEEKDKSAEDGRMHGSHPTKRPLLPSAEDALNLKFSKRSESTCLTDARGFVQIKGETAQKSEADELVSSKSTTSSSKKPNQYKAVSTLFVPTQVSLKRKNIVTEDTRDLFEQKNFN